MQTASLEVVIYALWNSWCISEAACPWAVQTAMMGGLVTRCSWTSRWQHGKHWSERWAASTRGDHSSGLWVRATCWTEIDTTEIHWVINRVAEGLMWMAENKPKNCADKGKWWWEAGRMKKEHRQERKGKKKQVRKEGRKVRRPGNDKHLQSLKPKQEIRKASGEQSWQKHEDTEASVRYSRDWGT